jgi:hypothetical protein
MSSSSPGTFAQRSAKLQVARDAANSKLNAERTQLDTAVAVLGGAVRWDHAALEAKLLAEIADEQAAFDAEQAEAEKQFIGFAIRELTTRVRAFRAKGDTETALAVISKLNQVARLKLEMVGRPVGAYGEPHELWLAMASTLITDVPTAIVAFTDPSALLSTAGTPTALERVARAAEHPELGAVAVEALRELELVCARIATSTPNATVSDETRSRWALLCSGKSAAAREEALAELEAAAQRRSRAEWDERRDRIRRVRAGDPEASKGMSGDDVESLLNLGAEVFGPVAAHVRRANPFRKGP